MSGVDPLAAHLQAELSKARESLGLPDTALTTPREMLVEAERIAELVSGRMRAIEEQLGTLETTRNAARSYVASDRPT